MKPRDPETRRVMTADQRDASEIRRYVALQDEWRRQLNVVRDPLARVALEGAIERAAREIEALQVRIWKRKCEREKQKQPSLFDLAVAGQAVKKAAAKKPKPKKGGA